MSYSVLPTCCVGRVQTRTCGTLVLLGGWEEDVRLDFRARGKLFQEPK